MRFCCLEDVLKIRKYLRKVKGYRIVGIFTDTEIFDEFEREGTFDVVRFGKNNTVKRKSIGFDILGCECCGKGNFCFNSYLSDSLNEVIEKTADIKFTTDSQTGLIQNSYEETEYFCSLIQGMGEFVIWTPFEVYEYLEKD